MSQQHIMGETARSPVARALSPSTITADYQLYGKKKPHTVYTQQELNECTFKPKISENSKVLLQDLTTDPVQERTKQILEQRERRIKEIRSRLEEQKQMTFKPNISDYSFRGKRTNFMESIDEQIQRRREFLEKCEIERKTREEKESIASFTPQITETSKQLGTRGGNVFDRLFTPKKVPSEEQSEMDLNSTTISSESKSKSVRSESCTPTDEKLFHQAKEREQKRKQLEEEALEQAKKLQEFKVNEKSEEFLKAKLIKDLAKAFKDCPREDELTITFSEFVKVLSNLSFSASKKEEQAIIDEIWKIMDVEGSGSIHFERYLSIMMAIFDKNLISKSDEPIRDKLEELGHSIKKLSINKIAFSKINEERFEKIKKETDKDLTFKPNINASTPKKQRESSEQSDTKNEPRYLKLMKQHSEMEEKMKRDREAWEKKKMTDCTFQPRTNSAKKSYGQTHNSNASSVSRFDLLYQMASKPKKPLSEKTAAEREIEECTFRPDTSQTKNVSLSKSIDFDSIKGFKETIGRIRKGNEERERLYNYFNNVREKAATTTDDFKNKKTEFKPFSFQLDKRKKSKPLLYMDVNLGVGKSGRLAIHEGDSAETLASNFAKTYKLDELLQKRLEQLIKHHIDMHEQALENDCCKTDHSNVESHQDSAMNQKENLEPSSSTTNDEEIESSQGDTVSATTLVRDEHDDEFKVVAPKKSSQPPRSKTPTPKTNDFNLRRSYDDSKRSKTPTSISYKSKLPLK
ncbi:hypothetical protein C9374_005103 [Naegleria lovaniensis]|uniref:EF-hand domain-containing protein n=1 Tax=Naegleria lovaniensis TaxID=51637 RepID=A0AA88GQ68_NAELO|nr:uncharacterized protein C9374_005103 [Naegleria lovaniensis]KAG2382523.1 hypothetical protein C9374_005103 [Naegleria lovaniensis]